MESKTALEEKLSLIKGSGAGKQYSRPSLPNRLHASGKKEPIVPEVHI